MLRVYTDILPTLGGYLTDKDQLHFGRFEAFVRQLARNEANPDLDPDPNPDPNPNPNR